MGVTLSAVIHRRGEEWLARCPELGTMAKGATFEDALAELKKVTAGYLENFEPPEDYEPAKLVTFELED
jgi:predicted RNase H-like HicB family nuclease